MYISIRYYFCVIKKFNVSCRYSSWTPPPPRYRWFNKLYLKKLEWPLIFSYIKTTDTIFAIFSKCLYPSDEKRYLMMKFSDFFFRNDIVWNKIYKSIKIQFPIALKNTNIKRTFSGKCVFQILSIFYKLTVLWVFAILFLKYSMCIVWVGKLWKKPNFLFQKNLFLNQFSKELQCVRNQQKAFFLKKLSLIRVSINYA